MKKHEKKMSLNQLIQGQWWEEGAEMHMKSVRLKDVVNILYQRKLYNSPKLKVGRQTFGEGIILPW